MLTHFALTPIDIPQGDIVGHITEIHSTCTKKVFHKQSYEKLFHQFQCQKQKIVKLQFILLA